MNMLTRFNIMPVKDKKPLVKWSELTERAQTLDERMTVIKQGGKGTIGIVCGPISKVFVLDDDGSDDLKHRAIPRTVTARTPRGGRHYYFAWTKELDNKITTLTGVLNKVDTRGQGGYVVWYGWQVGPTVAHMAKPPQWLLDLLPNKNERTIAVSTTVSKLASIKDGNRNATFASLAGGLRARGYSVEAIFELLLPKAREVGFDEQELQRTCQSIGRYEPAKADGQGQSVGTFLADKQKAEWICQPLVAKQSIGFMAGLPEAKKTWILMDLAIECARKEGIWLKKFPVESCRVLFIDQERAKSETQRRFNAMLNAKGLIGDSDVERRLFIRCGTSTRIDLQHSFDAFKKELLDLKPGLVIVDSFATFHTKEESNRMEIQQVLEHIKQLRNEFGCSFIFVHHETKASYQNHKEGAAPSYLDMSGNVAIPAAAEMAFSVVKHDDDSSMVHHTKSTIGIKVPPFITKVLDLNPEGTKISVEAY